MLLDSIKGVFAQCTTCYFYFLISCVSVTHTDLSTACSIPSEQLLTVFSVPFSGVSLNVWPQLCQPAFSSVWALAVQDRNAACVRQNCAALRKQPKRNKTSQALAAVSEPIT